MTDKMVDRVKAAMVATECDCAQWDDGPLHEITVAAVEAFREPSKAMVEASAVYFPEGFPSAWWQAVIDAAYR